MSVIILPIDKAVEICNSLPAPEIRKLPSVLAVMHPNDQDIVVLKSRFKEEETLALTVSDLECYTSPFLYSGNYSSFEMKKVLLDRKVLPLRAVELLKAYF